MTTTYTANLSLALQGTGDNNNSWGTVNNASVVTIVDQVLGSKLALSVAGSADVTLSTSQSQNLYFNFTGILTGNINVIFPSSAGRLIICRNSTTGAFSLTVKPSTGTGVVLPQNSLDSIVQIDGTANAAQFPIGYISSTAITSSTIDATTVGATTPSSGAFTTLAASGNFAVATNKFQVTAATGNTGIGAAASGTYALNVVQAGANQAYFGSTGTNTSQVMIDNAAGSQISSLSLQDAGTTKWIVEKNSDNTFGIYDQAGSAFFLKATTGGNLTLGASQTFFLTNGGNVLLNNSAQLGTANVSLTGNPATLAMRSSAAAAGKYFNTAVDANNSYVISNNSGTGVFVGDGSTSWGTVSDQRLKINVQPIMDALEKINAIRGVTFRYKKDEIGILRSGVIAQEVAAVFPEAIENAPMQEDDNTQYLGVKYTELIPLLIAAINELSEKLNSKS